MIKTVDYFFGPTSPWTYLGHDRFAALAREHGARINVRPVDYGRIFPVSGGLPLPKRAPQRQAYRLMELKRWRDFLGVPLIPQPRHFPIDSAPAALLIIAADRTGHDAMTLAGAIMRAVWAEERNVADPETLAGIVAAQRMPATLLDAAAESATRSAYDAHTEEAITRQVFGAPTYVYRDELFWGQDRLDFLARAMA